MNVPRMRALMKLIAAEPRRMRMEVIAEPVAQFTDSFEKIPEEQVPPCGTVMCIAGTAVLAEEQERGFFRKRFDQRFFDKIETGFGMAQKWLELTDKEAERLFFLSQHAFLSESCWPADLEEQYKAARTPKQRTAVVLARMRRFIKTDGRE